MGCWSNLSDVGESNSPSSGGSSLSLASARANRAGLLGLIGLVPYICQSSKIATPQPTEPSHPQVSFWGGGDNNEQESLGQNQQSGGRQDPDTNTPALELSSRRRVGLAEAASEKAQAGHLKDGYRTCRNQVAVRAFGCSGPEIVGPREPSNRPMPAYQITGEHR